MKEVKVYRFLTKDTYEQAMFRAASVKLGLDYAVMHNMSGRMEGISADRSAAHVSELSRKELENLLKHGAYGAFSEDKVEVDMTEEETIEQV
jgi:chromodomain-helicase-DNA-binding protein 7